MGACWLASLDTEADHYVERHRHERDAEGRALVVHHGRSQGRKLTLGAGTVELKAPRVKPRIDREQCVHPEKGGERKA